jgi:hypothetical protein
MNHTTACTIATARVRSKRDYCNNIHCFLIFRLLLIVFSLFSTLLLVLSPKPPVFIAILLFLIKSLRWVKINKEIHCKVTSLTYKVLLSNEPSHLRSCLCFSLQSSHSICSSSVVTLARPSIPSRLKPTNRSFYHVHCTCFLEYSSR